MLLKHFTTNLYHVVHVHYKDCSLVTSHCFVLQELRGFTLVLNVDPKHHPKIIGKRGANISRIRSNYDVQVQFPDKSDENGDQIKIIGYEHQAKAAQEAIMQIVQELVCCLCIEQIE